MPGIGNPIVIGGGIQLSGGAVNQFLVLSNITPPTATTSARLRLSGSSLIAESQANRGDTVIGPNNVGNANAAVNADVLIGSGITLNQGSSPNFANIVIGSTVSLTGGPNIIIGEQAAGVFNPFAGVGNTLIGRMAAIVLVNDSTVIGHSTSLGAGASSTVVIGRGASATGTSNVVVGQGASSSSGNNIVIGQGAGAAGARTIIIGSAGTATGTSTDVIAIGQSAAVANLSNIIAIGQGVSTSGLTAGDIVIGNNNLGSGGFSSRVVWGGADTHTSGTAVPAFTHRFKNAAGTNVAAGNLTFIAPRATGNAVGGAFVFQVGQVGASGAALQTATTVFRMESTQNIAFVPGGASAQYGSGIGVFFIADAVTVPTVNPASGGLLYSEGGALKWRGPAGTITTIAPA